MHAFAPLQCVSYTEASESSAYEIAERMKKSGIKR